MITIKPVLHFQGHTPVKAVIHIDNDQQSDTDGMSLEVTGRTASILLAQARRFEQFIKDTTDHSVEVSSVERSFDTPFNNKHKFD